MSEETSAPEFSRPFDVENLPRTGIEQTLTASAAECAAVAGRLGLVSVDALSAEIDLQPASKGGAILRGQIEADVVQTCVVTLEPVPAHVSEPFEVRFVPPSQVEEAAPGEEIELSEDDVDAPEPLGGASGTMLDAGEMVVQFMSLGLEPFPRKPGAEVPETFRGEKEPSPFAALAALKKDLPKGD